MNDKSVPTYTLLKQKTLKLLRKNSCCIVYTVCMYVFVFNFDFINNEDSQKRVTIKSDRYQNRNQ